MTDQKNVVKFQKKTERGIDVGMKQIAVILDILKTEPATSMDVVEKTHICRSSVCNQLKRLHDLGLVTRTLVRPDGSRRAIYMYRLRNRKK